MQLPGEVKRHLANGARIIDEVSKRNKYTYMSCDLDCASFPDPIWEKGAPLPDEILNILNHLPEKSFPALYYFEILSDIDKNLILKAYQEMKEDKTIGRACSALKKKPPTTTNVLYVGKVKNDTQGRVKVHLGYYHNGVTSGLQLVCWSKLIKLKLRLHVFHFEEDMAPYISILELPLANALNPMIGKQ